MDARAGLDAADADVVVDLPFRGRWTAVNSPARTVPSHGSDLFATTYAIDFVPVDERDRPAPWSWRALLATEPPERFFGFGAAVLSPAVGTVVAAHDGEADHVARRSPVTGVPYLLGQRARAAGGAPAIAGNHVLIAVSGTGPFLLLAHLRRGSVRVAAGVAVASGGVIGECGNSGNSTVPHVHVQASDSADLAHARGVPLAFRHPATGTAWIPGERESVDAG